MARKQQVIHINSSVKGSVPDVDMLAKGEIAVNINPEEPFLSIRTNNDSVVKISTDDVLETKFDAKYATIEEIEKNELTIASGLNMLNDKLTEIEGKVGEGSELKLDISDFFVTLQNEEYHVFTSEEVEPHIVNNMSYSDFLEEISSGRELILSISLNGTTMHYKPLLCLYFEGEDGGVVYRYMLDVNSIGGVSMQFAPDGLAYLKSGELYVTTDKIDQSLSKDSVNPISSKAVAIALEKNYGLGEVYYMPDDFIEVNNDGVSKAKAEYVDEIVEKHYTKCINSEGIQIDINYDESGYIIFEGLEKLSYVEENDGTQQMFGYIKINISTYDVITFSTCIINPFNANVLGGGNTTGFNRFLFVNEAVVNESELPEENKQLFKKNMGSFADWNAQEGEAGYIENKPFGVVEFNSVEWFYDDNASWCITPMISNKVKYEDVIYEIPDNDDELVSLGDGSIALAKYPHYDDNLMYVSCYGITESTDERLQNILFEVNTKLDEKFIPDTVLKTTPQTLSDTEKVQALTNLGLTDVVREAKLSEEISNVKQTIEENEEVVASALNELKDGINNINVDLLVNVIYEEVVELRRNSELKPGQQYRITDYMTTTTQENTQSAVHQFDIIVTADDVNVLNENARAIQHTNDENDYFHNSNLAAWELKYCLDNDTSGFAWADESDNGKGVIYYMKDEFNNECPYDFKNIQFARWELSSPVGYRNNYDSDNGVDNWNQESTPFDSLKTGFYGTNNSENVFFYGNNRYKVEYTISSQPTYCYTFGKDTDYSIDGSNYGNVIKEYKFNNKIQLNNIVFFGNGCVHNSFDNDCSLNSFGNICSYNSFGELCQSNSFGNYCSSNSFGNRFYDNSLGNYCSSNSFGNGFYSNNFGNSCDYNSFGNYCSGNSFGNECNSNSFGNDYSYNSFGERCSLNSFGNSCEFNSFGNGCVTNSFGNGCSSNSFGNSCRFNSFGDYCYSNSFGNECDSNNLSEDCNYNSFGEDCSSNSFGENCKSNSFDGDCTNNSFGNGCYNNSFIEYCNYNSFGNDCRSNNFDESCTNNSFGNGCSLNSFGNDCDSNSFGNDCDSNSFGNECDSNSFGNSCESNSFGESCTNNSFGNECVSNNLGSYCESNSFGNKCESNNLGESEDNPKLYYRYITFDNGNRYINLNCTSTTSSIKYYQNVRIGLGVNNTGTYKTINDSNVGQTYETCYKPANSQTITV